MVKTVDGAASSGASSQVELGGYLYDVRKSGTNWELYASGTVPESTPNPELPRELYTSGTVPEPTPNPEPIPAPA